MSTVLRSEREVNHLNQQAAHTIMKSLPSSFPDLSPYGASGASADNQQHLTKLITQPDYAEKWHKGFEPAMAKANAAAAVVRKGSRLSPSDRGIELAKANLDVGTLTNFAQITGGQSLGYVSLDTQMARGTIRPNSFTLYQALPKSAAFQVVDYWAYASDTGAALPGAAFSGFSNVNTGTLPTNYGRYELENIELKLLVDGRAITTALAAQNSFVDVQAQENINAALGIMESVDWANYWGNSTLFPNQYNGMSTFIPSANTFDYQTFASSTSSMGWTSAQTLFNLIYVAAGQVASYNNYGRITHAFMAPDVAADLQGVVTTLLNNFVNGMPGGQRIEAININGDVQGMRTRFGEIQFPIDLMINARDIPAQAIINGDGSNRATLTSPTPPATVTVAVSGGTNSASAWGTAYVASSGIYTYAVASCDQFMNESILKFASPVSGIAVNEAYVVTIAPPSDLTAAVYRVFRSGLGYTGTAPALVRYIGAVAANGSSNVTFDDLNTHIPGSESLFLFDLAEEDNALDWRYLLPLTRVELFAQNLFMPWAIAAIGAIRPKVSKFHALIKNYVPDNPTFNPLSANV
ncbi:MAG: hypothetical protein PHZ23_14740 [Acidiphilium sp.]|nr:hypothetical protein [Acidiphilium sp.]